MLAYSGRQDETVGRRSASAGLTYDVFPTAQCKGQPPFIIFPSKGCSIAAGRERKRERERERERERRERGSEGGSEGEPS